MKRGKLSLKAANNSEGDVVPAWGFDFGGELTRLNAGRDV